jgi:hypothetical protein
MSVPLSACIISASTGRIFVKFDIVGDFFFQALKLPLVESFGLLNDLFPFPSILDADYPVFDLHLADVLFDVILPSVLGSSL